MFNRGNINTNIFLFINLSFIKSFQSLLEAIFNSTPDYTEVAWLGNHTVQEKIQVIYWFIDEEIKDSESPVINPTE